MKQILQNLGTGETIVAEVPEPKASQGTVLINSSCSLVSVGTEKMLVDFGEANLLDKARSQPEKVQEVLRKIRSDGIAPTGGGKSKVGAAITAGLLQCRSGCGLRWR